MASRKTLGRTLYGIMTILVLIGAKYCFDDAPTPEGNDETQTETEDIKNVADYEEDLLPNYLPTGGVSTDQIIQHKHFTLRYSDNHKQAEWVAYELTKEMVENHGEERVAFRPDPMIEKNAVIKADYTGMGYDRGHLCPAADMGWDEEAMKESFYMTNMSPQEPRFNRGIWKKLEGRVRKWAVANKQIYVVVGPVLTKRAKKRFPKEKKRIAVPHSFYKVILDYRGPDIKAISFIMKNEESDELLSNFAVSIDDVEELTGLDFFPDLPDDIETEIESTFDPLDWDLDVEKDD